MKKHNGEVGLYDDIPFQRLMNINKYIILKLFL